MWMDFFSINNIDVEVQDSTRDKANGLAVTDENGKLLDAYIPNTDISDLPVSAQDPLKNTTKDWIKKIKQLGANTQLITTFSEGIKEQAPAPVAISNYVKKDATHYYGGKSATAVYELDTQTSQYTEVTPEMPPHTTQHLRIINNRVVGSDISEPFYLFNRYYSIERRSIAYCAEGDNVWHSDVTGLPSYITACFPFKNKIIVLGGSSSSTTSANTLYYSEDGLTFSHCTMPSLSGWYAKNLHVSLNNDYIYTTGEGRLLASFDGITWQDKSNNGQISAVSSIAESPLVSSESGQVILARNIYNDSGKLFARNVDYIFIAFLTSQTFRFVLYYNSAFYAFSYDGNIYKSSAAYHIDANIQWTNVGTYPLPPTSQTSPDWQLIDGVLFIHYGSYLHKADMDVFNWTTIITPSDLPSGSVIRYFDSEYVFANKTSSNPWATYFCSLLQTSPYFVAVSTLVGLYSLTSGRKFKSSYLSIMQTDTNSLFLYLSADKQFWRKSLVVQKALRIVCTDDILIVHAVNNFYLSHDGLQMQIITLADSPSAYNCIAIHGNNILLGTQQGLYISTDGGITFTKSADFSTLITLCAYIEGVWYVGEQNNGLYSSTDLSSWTKDPDGSIATVSPYYLVLCKNKLLMSTLADGVWLKEANWNKTTTSSGRLIPTQYGVLLYNRAYTFVNSPRSASFTYDGQQWISIPESIGYYPYDFHILGNMLYDNKKWLDPDLSHGANYPTAIPLGQADLNSYVDDNPDFIVMNNSIIDKNTYVYNPLAQ